MHFFRVPCRASSRGERGDYSAKTYIQEIYLELLLLCSLIWFIRLESKKKSYSKWYCDFSKKIKLLSFFFFLCYFNSDLSPPSSLNQQQQYQTSSKPTLIAYLQGTYKLPLKMGYLDLSNNFDCWFVPSSFFRGDFHPINIWNYPVKYSHFKEYPIMYVVSINWQDRDFTKEKNWKLNSTTLWAAAVIHKGNDSFFCCCQIYTHLSSILSNKRLVVRSLSDFN